MRAAMQTLSLFRSGAEKGSWQWCMATLCIGEDGCGQKRCVVAVLRSGSNLCSAAAEEVQQPVHCANPRNLQHHWPLVWILSITYATRSRAVLEPNLLKFDLGCWTSENCSHKFQLCAIPVDYSHFGRSGRTSPLWSHSRKTWRGREAPP